LENCFNDDGAFGTQNLGTKIILKETKVFHLLMIIAHCILKRKQGLGGVGCFKIDLSKGTML
jgi:hypothetical protein